MPGGGIVQPGDQRLGPCPEVVGPSGDHPPDRDLADGQTGPVQPERRGERGERRLVGSGRSSQRVLAQPGDEVGPTDDQAGLRTADELVAAERDDVGAGRQSLARRRLVGETERPRSAAVPRSRGRRRRSPRDDEPARPAPSDRAPRRSPPAGSSRGGRGGPAARRRRAVRAKSATRVRFVVPTSTRRAPARRTISGIRTPPPISTSSPRDTTTRPPRPASPTASASAAALLLATRASSAPVSAMRCSSAAGTAPRAGRRRGRARGGADRPRPLARRRSPRAATAPGRGSCGRSRRSR